MNEFIEQSTCRVWAVSCVKTGYPGPARKEKRELILYSPKYALVPHPSYTFKGNSAHLERHNIQRKITPLRAIRECPGRKAEVKVKFMHVYENSNSDANRGQIQITTETFALGLLGWR